MHAQDRSDDFSFSTPAAAPADHPLRRLFHSLLDRAFLTTLGLYDSQITQYLADIMTDFSHSASLYRLRDLSGRPLTEVAEMLLEADFSRPASSFSREREVHKHIGDFTLFWTGVFPDALPRMQSAWRRDSLLDFVHQGKSSYAIAASHDYGAYQEQAPVLKRLSDEFDLCLAGLNAVRRDLNGLALTGFKPAEFKPAD